MPPGRYTLIRELGRGGFGVVWLAEDPQLGRRVALKILEGADVARFQREARIAAGLSHPNIAAVYEAADDYIAMQFIDGAPLSALRLPPREALEAVRDAARAVHYAHERGIIHRDLKPHNLMRGDRVYVLDFGLARPMERGSSITVSETILGTPAYMSPEQAMAEPADARSDVYGLGATLYDLLAGRPPFSGPRPLEVLRQVIERDPEPLRVERDVRTIVERAMEKEPARRYESAAALADDIDRYLRGDPILARPASPFYRLRKRLAKRKALVAAIALAVVALAVVWHVKQGQKEEAEQLGAQAVEALQKANDALLEYERERLKPLHPMTAAKRLLVEAEARLVEAVRAHPNAHAVWARLGDVRIRLFRIHEARNAYAEAVRLAPTNGDYHYGLGLADSGLLELYLASLVDVESARDDEEMRAVFDRMMVSMRAALQYGGGDERVARINVSIAERAWDDAVRVADEVEASGTDSIPALSNAAIVYFHIKELDRAARLIDRAVDGARSDLGAYAMRAFVNLARMDYEAVLKDVDDMLAIDPDFAKAYNVAGSALQSLKRFDEALDAYDRAVELEPSLTSAYFGRGKTRLLAGDAAGAIADLTVALERFPRSTRLLTERGDAYRKAGDVDRALADLDHALEIDADDAALWRERARVRFESGDLTGGRDDYARAGEIEPTDTATWINRSYILLQLAEYVEAEHDAGLALRVDADSIDALLNRASARAKLMRTEEAVDDYSRILSRQPDHADALYWRAKLLLRLRRTSEARVDADRLLKASPASPEVLELSGDVFAAEGRHVEAIGRFTQALGYAPDDDDLYESRAYARYWNGDLDGAAEDCTAAVEGNPKNGSAWRLRGTIHQRAGRLDDAYADYTRALDANPDDETALTNRGGVLVDLGRYDEAIADLDRAVSAVPRDAASRLNRGRAHAELGHAAEAVVDFELYLELAPADDSNRDAVEKWVRELKP